VKFAVFGLPLSNNRDNRDRDTSNFGYNNEFDDTYYASCDDDNPVYAHGGV
jgi:hypothetical protein